MTVRRAVAKLLALLRAGQQDRDLDDDVLAHLELAERDAIAAGMSPEEARRAARREFGGIDLVKEEHRDSRGIRWLEILLKDFRYGIASLVRNPGFAAVIIGVLALGIGANVAVFSLVDAVLLKPIPFPKPEQIVRIWEAPRPGATNATSTLDFLDWKRLGTTFQAMSAELPISVALTGKGEPERISGKAVTTDFFRVFATRPLLGRVFRPGEDQPGAAPVIVISHAAWMTYFGGDADILERRPILDGVPHQVVGVLAAGVFDRDEAAFWKPLIFTPAEQIRDTHWLTVYGRLRDGVTAAQAQQQMTAIHAELADLEPQFKRDWSIVVELYGRLLVGDNLRRSIVVAFGAVALVLLIACSNVANLLLAKGAARRKELAVRAALGAGRGRLVAQLLTESLALCVAGGAAGVALAWLLLRAAAPFLSESVPYTADVTLDLRALAFASAIALGVALAIGALPSLQTNFGRLAQSLNHSMRGSSGTQARFRRLLVMFEVAVSLVLLCGAALLFRSLLNMEGLETGVRIDNVITMSAELPLHDYPTPASAALFYQSVTERLKAAPGVERVGLASHLPLRWINNGEGLQAAGVEQMINVRFKRVDAGYFAALDIPVIAGRGITPADRAGSQAAVVINETLAARLAEAANMPRAVGRHVQISTPNYEQGGFSMRDYEVAGIIRNERVTGPGGSDPPVAYVALAQTPRPDLKLLVRTQADAAAIMPTIREAIHGVDPNLPLGDIATMRQVRSRTLSGASRPAWLIGIFAAVAALLAALGLYGVLAHAVAQQRREIGIRMAVGAGTGDVLAQVMRAAMSMIAAGLVVGLAGAAALTRWMQSLLFEVSPLDPAALAIACTLMTLLGLLAAWGPARRAARTDPMAVLRDEG